MSIPQNIHREHVSQAMNQIIREGVPNKRRSRKWLVHFEGIEDYPPKYLISLANLYANGEELDPNPKIFTSNMAVDYLRELGFAVNQA